jgi:hypothetical protein
MQVFDFWLKNGVSQRYKVLLPEGNPIEKNMKNSDMNKKIFFIRELILCEFEKRIREKL